MVLSQKLLLRRRPGLFQLLDFDFVQLAATSRLARRDPMVRRADEVSRLASPHRLPLDQIMDLAEHGAMVHRNRPVTGDRGTSLGHHLPIGYLREFERANVFHAIAVQFQQAPGRLQ